MIFCVLQNVDIHLFYTIKYGEALFCFITYPVVNPISEAWRITLIVPLSSFKSSIVMHNVNRKWEGIEQF